MSILSKTFGSDLLSGHYHGRIFEVTHRNENQKDPTLRKNKNILVLIKDKLYRFNYEGDLELSSGQLISFEICEKGDLVNLITRGTGKTIGLENDVLRWRRPTQNPSRMQLLRIRHRILGEIREWFDMQEFVETETPILVYAPSPESQLSPVKTDSGFLITSPEFQMKRLLVGGFDKIYQFARCFREGEIGPFHNPEFTILEWYRSEEKLEVLMSDIEQVVSYIVKNIFKGNPSEKVSLPPWPRMTVSSIFKKYLNIFLDGSESSSQLRLKAQYSGYNYLLDNLTIGSEITENLAYERVFFRLWNYVEKEFLKSTTVFVYEWPLPLASLACACSQNTGFAERVELYANGIELANGFMELTDPVEQRKRFEQDLLNRYSEGRSSVPLDEKFLESLKLGLQNCSGMALGVDRLIMWLCGAKKIRDVLCFSQDEL